jgi:hypothetical protein
VHFSILHTQCRRTVKECARRDNRENVCFVVPWCTNHGKAPRRPKAKGGRLGGRLGRLRRAFF